MYSLWSSFFQRPPKCLIKPNKPICARILVDENNFNQVNIFYRVTKCQALWLTIRLGNSVH